MTPEKWERISEILEDALAVDGAERAAYLDRTCEGDLEVRREVESLLISHERVCSSFLHSPLADLQTNTQPSPRPPIGAGRRIGPYLVEQEVGHGGMGEVFSAVRADGQYEKKVAIKLVRSGYDTAAVLERFLHERQILAGLDHPNVARLLDGGNTEEGIPYFVMELVEGVPIDAYCDAAKLSVTDRLQLFHEVCAAVQYAHQRLVIHRDIKPSNILVTAEGVPKLLDFGISKLLDASGEAEATLLRPMTPEYASPEQIRGEPISTATDVYSLGVVLYQLLTGRSPYRVTSPTPAKLAEAITHDEPERPSSSIQRAETVTRDDGTHQVAPESISCSREDSPLRLQRRLRGDLDAIVLKALRKEPPLRYVSVGDFAEDIRRHLAKLPVGARKGTWSYRAAKFVRRHRVAAVAAAFTLITLVTGVLVTVREARIAQAERARAERRFNDVRKLANSFLFEFDDAIKDLPGSTPARSLVVRRALEYLDGLAAEARGDRSLQVEIAFAYNKVGEVQGDPMFPNLGDSQGALQSSLKALAILEELLRTLPDNQRVRLALASTHQRISDVLAFSGDSAGAVEHSGKALKLYEELVRSLESDQKFRTQWVTQTYHYANLLKLAGRLDESAAEYQQAVELSQQIIVARPSDQEGKVHLATSLDGLGNVLQEKGDTAGALENRSKGLTIREELASRDPNNAHYRRQLAFSHHNVGLSLVEAGDLTAALEHFRQESSLFESLSVADPKDVQGRRNRSLANKQIGDTLMHLGDVRGALSQYRSALSIDRALASADPGNYQAVLDLSFAESKVGSALAKLGRTREGLVLLRSGVARQESLLAQDPSHILLYNHLANSYTLLADCLLHGPDKKAAIDYYRKAVAARLTLAEKSPNSVANRGALAKCYANLAKALGPYDSVDSLKQYNNAVDLLERLTAADSGNAQNRIALADALTNTARFYVHLGAEEPWASVSDWTKAKSFYERSQASWMELEKAGRLPPERNRAMQEVAGELARCNALLAKLRPNN